WEVGLWVVSGALTVVGSGKFWLEPDRLAVVADSAVKISLDVISVTATAVGRGVSWIEPDRLAVVGNGVVVVMLAGVSVAAVIVGNGPASCAHCIRIDQRGAIVKADIGRSQVLSIAIVPLGRSRCMRRTGQQQQCTRN